MDGRPSRVKGGTVAGRSGMSIGNGSANGANYIYIRVCVCYGREKRITITEKLSDKIEAENNSEIKRTVEIYGTN